MYLSDEEEEEEWDKSNKGIERRINGQRERERERESMNSGYHCDDIFGKKKENIELQIRKTWIRYIF